MHSLVKRCVPRFSFASLKTNKTCTSTRPLYLTLKQAFKDNSEELISMIFKTDLRFTSLVAHNLHHFSIEDDQLREGLLTNMEYREKEITADILLDLTINFRSLVKLREADFYETLFEFTQEYSYLFDQSQLEAMEKVYFDLNRSFIIHFPVAFGPLIKKCGYYTAALSPQLVEKTLDLYAIKQPKKHMDISIVHEQDIIRVKFPKLQKNLTLVGLSDSTMQSLMRLRDIINKGEYDFYLLGLPPLSKSDLPAANPKKKSNRNIDVHKHIDPELLGSRKTPEVRLDHPQLGFFDKYGEMALMNGALLEWYRDNVLNGSEVYKVQEDYKIVSRQRKGLEMPDELQTILYALSTISGEKPSVLFSDIKVYDEMNILAQDMELEVARELLKYSRLLWLQELSQWGIRVNRNGCLKCSKSHTALPSDIIDIIPRSRYNTEMREGFIAKQIVQSLVSFNQNKNYIGFYPKNLMYGILRELAVIFEEEGDTVVEVSKQEPEKEPELDEELFEQFLRTDEKSRSIPKGTGQAKQEHTEKLSILLSLIEQSDRKTHIKIPEDAGLDWDLYKKLRGDYANMFRLNSFLKTNKNKWNIEQESCFAASVILK